MSETDTQHEHEQGTQPNDEPTGTHDTDDTDTGEMPDRVKEVMRKERQQRREADKRANDLAARLKEIEDRDKTEAERLREQAEAAARESAEARAQLMRERVARRMNVPDELVDRLRGDNEEALEEDAKSLLGAITAREPEPPPRGPKPADGDTPPSHDLTTLSDPQKVREYVAGLGG